jgi:hypothetical protein
MKKILLILIIFLSVNLSAQNVYDRKVNFEYIRLPQQPLNKSLKYYEAGVVLEYVQDNIAKKKAYADLVARTEKQYEEDVKNYDQKVKDAGVQYAKDLAAYNIRIKTVTNPESVAKPELILPEKPEKIIPADNNYYQKEFNTTALADSYINLQGYTKGYDNAVRIIFLLKGFQYQDPQLKFEEVSRTKDGIVVKEKEYYYQISYRHPMGLKVESPFEGIVCNEYFKELERYDVAKTQKYKSEAELIAAFDKNTFFASFEDRIVAENMKFVNDVLNNRFGFTRLRAVEEINLVNGKKYNYNDYQQAFEAAITGFNQLGNGVDKTVAAQNLNAAISIWENALKESQPLNKKARINGNVTTATMFNIALVAIYADEFAKSEMYLNRIYAMDSSKREQRRVEQIRAFMKDQQARAEAYKKI